MCVIGPRGSGGCWAGNVIEGPRGSAGLEMTWSEGRAPILQNQSSHLQGERRKDKDSSPHRKARTHTRGKGMHALSHALSHTLAHARTHSPEYNILCVIFKYGFREGLSRRWCGPIMVSGHRGRLSSLERPNTRVYFFSHTANRF